MFSLDKIQIREVLIVIFKYLQMHNKKDGEQLLSNTNDNKLGGSCINMKECG